MCGIAGFIGKGLISETRIEDCLYEMKKRGPDGNGYFFEKLKEGVNVQLLHSRLRILDLDDGSNQPFMHKGGCLSFNGEIYNYLELRERIVKKGHQFLSNGDTEVLASILKEEGVSGLNLCEGMWALAWLNEGKLYLARDRFGEKPLYYYQDEMGVYFGSEPKFIFQLLGKKLPINKEHLARYIVNGYKSLFKTNENFFLGLCEVPPGSFVVIDSSGLVQPQKYWNPKFSCENKDMSFLEAVEKTRHLLIESVKIRLRSDVPVAFCLSGGIDSNALASIAKKKFNYDVHGFTIINSDLRYEESDMIDTSVNSLGIRHTSVSVNCDNFLENLQRLISYHDSPISTITYYAHWQLMGCIADHGYKVSVSGTGADEFFSGYYDHHNFYLSYLSKNSEKYQQALDDWKRVVHPLVRNPFLQDPDCFIKNAKLRDHIFLDSEIFSSYMINGWSESFREEYFGHVNLRNRMNNELFYESVPVILHEDDLNSMYYSVENRSPFLDVGLFNHCQAIPTEYLIQKAKAKAVLRESLRGIVADPILDNPRKVGFNVPLLDYLDLNNPFVRNKVLEDSPIFQIVKKGAIESFINKRTLKNSESKFLFNFINAKIFLEMFG
jgi:asparagine synthase (glutamine-hydrolysing)